jgi:hypothetical protein
MSVDCNLDANIFKKECDKDDTAFGKRAQFCNLNKENAYSNNCVEFCKTYPKRCFLKKRYDFCKDNEIDDTNCDTEEKIRTIQNRCVKYGLLDNNFLITPNSFGLTDKGEFELYLCNSEYLKKFEDECKKYNVDLGICNFELLNNKKFEGDLSFNDYREEARARRQEILDFAIQQKTTNEETHKDTRDSIMELLNVDLLPKDVLKKYLGGVDTQSLIVAGVVSLVLLLSLVVFLVNVFKKLK